MITPSTAVRLAGLQRGVTGAALLVQPVAVTRLLAGHDSPCPTWIVRVLGARLLAQGGAELTRPTRPIVVAAAIVDAAHAASMIATAALVPQHRRVAATSAAEAALSSAAGLIIAQRLLARRTS